MADYAENLKILSRKIQLSASGYRKFTNDSYELFIDVGEVGPTYQPGHAHADSLSFLLKTDKPFIVDTGLSTYNVGSHRHAPEIEQLLNREFKKNVNVIMVPHLLPIKRGIMSNIYILRNTTFNEKNIINEFKKYYSKSNFVKILDNRLPEIKEVQNTNYCYIGIKVLPNNKSLLISCVIDNLLKGAASQAIQNMNLLFGLEENLGL